MAGRHAGADHRPACGLHPVRHHRRGRAAERQFAAMQHFASEMGQSTKSLRDSPLRGAGELIKLNPLSTEQGYIGTVIDLD